MNALAYLKWFLLFVVDILLLPTLLVAPQVIALFTKEQAYTGQSNYKWGWIWGTHDNPPQGDRSFVTKRAFFPSVVTGWKGYVNRVQWMWRNKLYGFAKYASLEYNPSYTVTVKGNPDISDKDKVSGWYFVTLKDGEKLVGFEFYCVLPYTKTRDLRCRLGWKILTSKFERFGFAQHVGTFNPFDGYGDD